MSELSFTDSERRLLREKNAKLNDLEFDAFLSACKRYQLNPLANQIYARLQPATDKNPRQVTYCAQIDGYRLIADRTEAYAGNDDPKFDNDKDPKRATVTVYKIVGGQRCGFEASARWDQYYPGDRQGFMWKKMPHLMLGKCAEALALRKAFPAALAGLYTLEEMEQADGDHAAPPTNNKPAAKPPAPKPTPTPAPKKSTAAHIAATKQPVELINMLNGWLEKKPVAKHLDDWKRIINEADDHREAADWSGAGAEELVKAIGVISKQIVALDLNKEADEAFNK